MHNIKIIQILNAVRQGQDDDGANEHASLKKKRAWIRHHVSVIGETLH